MMEDFRHCASEFTAKSTSIWLKANEKKTEIGKRKRAEVGEI
jgi:hypothetical protein